VSATRSLVAGGVAILLAFLALVGGVALITAEQAQQQSASNPSGQTGTLDATALPAAAQQWIPFIEAAGSVCPQITAPLVAAQIEAESGWNPNAVSPTGAEGLAQFEPGTWATWGAGSPLDPGASIAAEGKFMCALAGQMSSLAQQSGISVVDLALAAYNAGSAPVLACGCIPNNGQTSQYVQRIDALEASFTIVLASAGGDSGPAGLGTPLPCPDGAVQVTPSNVPPIRPGINYCFGAGTYAGASFRPANGDGFFGGGHATLQGDGQGHAFYADSASNVTIDGFAVLGYSDGGCGTSGACYAIQIQHGDRVTVSDNVIGPSSSGAIGFGNGSQPGSYPAAYLAGVSNSTISHNLITHVGYSGTLVAGGSNDTVSYNEVTRTDQFNVDIEADVAAIGKFAVDANTRVVGNYVHDNNDTAIWFDVFNVSTTIEGNTVTNNRVGIFYELSCAPAWIEGNTITNNGWADASAGSRAWGSGVRVSASGNNTRAPCSTFNPGTMPGPQQIVVEQNTFTGNWDDVVLFSGHGPGIPSNSVVVTANTISQTGGPGIIDTSGGNSIVGNNLNGATPTPILASSSAASAFGLAVVAAAAAELGKPYLWGGAGPAAFDCSGLVMVAVEAASHGAIVLPHSSEIQATLGQAVSLADLEPGDVIAFALSGGSNFDHIGLYAGGGYMIDAPHTDGFVRLDKIDPNSYWQSVPWAIRRFG